MDWIMWSPFQSARIRELCSHLTSAERSTLIWRSGAYGLWGAFTFAIPASVEWVAATRYGHAFPVWAYCLVAVPIVIHLMAIPIMRRSQRRFLENTHWARGPNASDAADV
jgi:hypothetical protein